jgi:hypothetical protein
VTESISRVDGRKQVAVADVQPSVVSRVGVASQFNVEISCNLLQAVSDSSPVQIDVVISGEERHDVPRLLKIGQGPEGFRMAFDDAFELRQGLGFRAPIVV